MAEGWASFRAFPETACVRVTLTPLEERWLWQQLKEPVPPPKVQPHDRSGLFVENILHNGEGVFQRHVFPCSQTNS